MQLKHSMLLKKHNISNLIENSFCAQSVCCAKSQKSIFLSLRKLKRCTSQRNLIQYTMLIFNERKQVRKKEQKKNAQHLAGFNPATFFQGALCARPKNQYKNIIPRQFNSSSNAKIYVLFQIICRGRNSRKSILCNCSGSI